MVDNTVNKRVKKQRDCRVQEGWHEVRVWVPTKADAEEVQALAAAARAKAQQFDGLLELEGIKNMNQEHLSSTLLAIREHGSKAYLTPSGPILDLLTELADKGDFADVSKAFIIFAKAYPSNAPFVAEYVPAKILNALCKQPQLNDNIIYKWVNNNQGWAERITQNLRKPDSFDLTIRQLMDEIKNYKSKAH